MSENVAKSVREGLRALGKGQAWLAEELGVSINAVSKWCRTGNISRANIPKVAEKLRLPLSDFYEISHAQSLHPPHQDTHDSIAPLATDEIRRTSKSSKDESRIERVNADESELLQYFRGYSSDEARQLLLSHARLLNQASR